MVVCYIAVGSNLGDREYYIRTALKKIRQLPETKLQKISSLIETPPEGGPPGQKSYLNGVIEILTGLFPYRLLQALQKIESELGRVRTVPNAPRQIDLDILVYGDAVISEQALVVPHPRMLSRQFVLKPLREIAPGLAEKIGKKKHAAASKLRAKPKTKKRRLT